MLFYPGLAFPGVFTTCIPGVYAVLSSTRWRWMVRPFRHIAVIPPFRYTMTSVKSESAGFVQTNSMYSYEYVVFFRSRHLAGELVHFRSRLVRRPVCADGVLQDLHERIRLPVSGSSSILLSNYSKVICLMKVSDPLPVIGFCKRDTVRSHLRCTGQCGEDCC